MLSFLTEIVTMLFRSLRPVCAGLALVLLGTSVQGQTFQYNNGYGDLVAGFRKPGIDNFELVVNLGNVYTNIEKLTPGTVVTYTQFTPTQLANAFASGFGNLQWSVFSAYTGTQATNGFQANTLWYTQPRANASVQSTPPTRGTSITQRTTKNQILGVAYGAGTISTSLSSNVNNTVYLVREPVGDPSALTVFIGDLGDPTIGDFQSLPPAAKVENKTPSSFTSVSRSDFYRIRPTGSADPETGLTTGSAYYLGYFSLNTDGTFSFTRATAAPPLPPQPLLKIQRVGTSSTVSLATTNGATYKLYYTNAIGITTPVLNWPSISTNLTGNGNTNSFLDITTDAVRFYDVIAY